MRGEVPQDEKLAEAIRTRLDQLLSMDEPRIARVWELGLLVQQHLGLSALGREGIPADVRPLLSFAASFTAGAALASSPRLSDVLLGAVRVTSGARIRQIRHERRPIDPIDFLRAFCFASLLRERAALEALAVASDWVDPDPGFEGRAQHERDLYRGAFKLLCGAQVTRADVDEVGARLEAVKDRLDEFRRLRFEALVLPLLAGAASDDADAAVRAALHAHHGHFGEAHRRAEPAGLIAWGALALLGRFAGQVGPEALASDYLPSALVALGLEPGPANSIVYEAPLLMARTLAEARLRVASAIAGPIAVQGRIDRGRGGDPFGVTLVAGSAMEFRVPFEISEDHSDESYLGAGISTVLDPGELTVLAETKRGAADAAERALGKSCAEQALAALGERSELYRNAMSSPLGRHLCDDHPEKFTRAALLALVASFDA